MSPRVLFYVQHLLGIGHLKRAAAIASAMAAAGLDVTVAHGGEAVPEVGYPGAAVHRLPPAAIRGGDFSTLVDENGRDADDAWRERRRGDLLALAGRLQPDAVLLELFPFGRRQFRFELLPLLDELWKRPARPAILSSVRDILVRPVRLEREVEAAETVRRRFDAVLVHGDPALVPFGESFGQAGMIAGRLRYTGYVSSDPSGPTGAGAGAAAAAGGIGDGDGDGEVIVSAGGGAAGAVLMRAALAARSAAGPAAGARTWRFLTGPRLPEEDFRALAAQVGQAAAAGGGRILVERFRADFPQLLKRAALSISQGGYNTTIDVLRAGVPAIIVPIGAEDETEQSDRAMRLAARGYLHVVPEAAAGGPALALTVEAALADAPRRRAMAPVDFALDGAAATARIVKDHAERRPR